MTSARYWEHRILHDATVQVLQSNDSAKLFGKQKVEMNSKTDKTERRKSTSFPVINMFLQEKFLIRFNEIEFHKIPRPNTRRSCLSPENYKKEL